MTNLFSSYRLINAQSIVQKNIDPNNIKRDITALLTALVPLKYILDTTDGSALEEHIITKLNAKSGITDVFIYFGYIKNDAGIYIYQSPKNEQERKRREDGTNEFQKFFTQLKTIQNGNLQELEDFLRHSGRNNNNEPDEISLTDLCAANNGNAETLQLIKLLKESLVTPYDTPPVHSFIRRKLAFMSFKQKYSNLLNASDDVIDQIISRKISSLKEKDTQIDVPRTDHVYIECLIRADFNETDALDILRKNRPNLEIPPEQAVPKLSMKTSIDNLKEPLQQHYRLLNQSNNKTQSVRQLSMEEDKWEQLKYIIPAIRQIRKTNNPDEHFSKMYRLLYSELSNIIGKQAMVKIEMFASVLCELPIENMENLDMITIKNILSSRSSQIHDDFQTHALSFLSVDCPICANSYPRSQMETMLLCSHMCCLGCLKDYYRNNVNNIDTGSVNLLTCFMERHEITSETHQYFFTCLEAKLNQWFHNDPDFLTKYHDKIFHATSGKLIKKCGNSKCISSFYVDDNDEITAARCPYCQFYQCGQCCRKWYPEHKNISCDNYTDWLFENDEDDPDVQAWRFLSRNGIICPNKNCQSVYDYKAGGCEHFTCDKCKTHFCRMCSVLYYFPTKDPKCPLANCTLKNTMHAHCPPNCFRETRIGTIEAITELLENHDINIEEELEKQPISNNTKCAVEDCSKPLIDISENRFCESCYKQFLCSLVWNYQLQPWEIYEDNNLEQMLRKASIPIPANTTREQLIQLCNQYLNSTLGKPKKITRQKV